MTAATLSPRDRDVIRHWRGELSATAVGAARIERRPPALIAAGYLTPGNCTPTAQALGALSKCEGLSS